MYIFICYIFYKLLIEEVKNLEKMKMYHMSVIYDKSTNKLVGRKLKPGAGESMYGLEVCNHDLDDDFLVNT